MPRLETQVRSQGREDPLEKEMATHSSILAWEISWTEEPGGLRSRGHKESDTTEQVNNNTSCHVGNAQHTAVHSRGSVSLGNTIHLSSQPLSF